MAGKHSSDWYKKGHKYDKYRENLDYVDKRYDNAGPTNYGQLANNGIGQSIQSLVGDERLVTAIQTIVERHAAEAFKNLEDKINTDSRRSVDHRLERHSTSGSRTYDNPNYSSDNRYNNDLVSSHRSDVRSGSDLIDYFDPDNVNQNIEDWLDKIDHLGSIHNWSEYERCYYMQNRLTGAAKTWYNRLRSTDLLWHEWKNGLVTTFSTRLDYASMISEMLARRKQSNETIAQYFNDKVRLCERCDFTNDKSVSFIIYGLPKEYQAEARAYRCWTPNELYEELLSKLDKTQAADRQSPENVEKRSKEPSKDKYYPTHSSHEVTLHDSHTKRHHDDSWEKKRESEGRRESKSLRTSSSRTKPSLDDKKKRCYNCRQAGGHLSKDCPIPKRCWDCGSKNHKAGDCKLKSSRLMK